MPPICRSASPELQDAEKALPSSPSTCSSMNSLSSDRKPKSQVSKIYKEASELYLTRNFTEAFNTIEQLVRVPHCTDDETVSPTAPVSTASKNSRVKVWVLYLALLDAILKLGPEEAKASFETKTWTDINKKAQDGGIWDEVVAIGYGGVQGKVDAEVVSSLATFLLEHSSSQKLNLDYLESYFSTSMNSKLELGDTFHGHDASVNLITQNALHNGADTPEKLNALVKIVEIFTLHVLPQNNEWEYARDFLTRSELLSEDIKGEMLQCLEALETENSSSDGIHENTEQPAEGLTEQEPQPIAGITAGQMLYTTYEEQPSKGRRSQSENDYGIDNPKSAAAVPKPKSASPQPIIRSSRAPQSKSSRPSTTKASRRPPSTSVYGRGINAISTIRGITSKLAEQLAQNPMALLRFLLFLVGLITAFSRRDVKDKVGRLTRAGWEKVKQTIGMGVKSSYI